MSSGYSYFTRLPNVLGGGAECPFLYCLFKYTLNPNEATFENVYCLTVFSPRLVFPVLSKVSSKALYLQTSSSKPPLPISI